MRFVSPDGSGRAVTLTEPAHHFLNHANISTSSRYLKPSKLAPLTTIKRIDAQRRESGEAAKWEQALAELRKNLPQGPQKWPHADKISRQREAGKP